MTESYQTDGTTVIPVPKNYNAFECTKLFTVIPSRQVDPRRFVLRQFPKIAEESDLIDHSGSGSR